jgi:hypothetical protein
VCVKVITGVGKTGEVIISLPNHNITSHQFKANESWVASIYDEEKWDLSLLKRSALPDISSGPRGEGCFTFTNDSTT